MKVLVYGRCADRTWHLIITCVLTLSLSPLFGQQEELMEEILQLANTNKLEVVNEIGPPTPPDTPNPYLSLLPPHVKRDYEGWARYEERRAKYLSQYGPQSIQAFSLTGSGPKVIEETENNDSQHSGQRLRRFGTSSRKRDHLIIEGSLGPDTPLVFTEGLSTEDNGSILLATETGLLAPFNGVTYEGVIGDGPVGVSDFDFFKVSGVSGELIFAEVRTPDPIGDLDPFVAIWNEFGVLLAANDDGFANSFDSFIEFTIPSDGDYYLSIGGYGAFIPNDPFDSQSGSIFGSIGSVGSYDARISKVIIQPDIDYFSFNLRKGDIVAGGLTAGSGLGSLTIEMPNDGLVVSTAFNTSLYPLESPLNLTGNASIYHIAEESSMFTIAVAEGYGAYNLELRLTRSNFEENGGTQILFIDYDGAEFDRNAFLGGPDSSDIRTLSPFRDFLPAWGLSDDPKSVVKITNRITRVVKENVKKDLQRSRINPLFNVIIVGNTGLGSSGSGLTTTATNSTMTFQGMEISKDGLDDPTLGFLEAHALDENPFPVSRVIVGGTTEESGINTIGVAQSIDPGNFGTEETALVLLDILSADLSGNPQSFSLNDVPLAPSVSKEDLVVTGVGNITSHEIGHYIGNWHNDGFDGTQTIMDEGSGGPFNLFGVGPSGVFGESDTQDVDFGTSAYSQGEFFTGIENTTNQSAWGLTSNFWPFFLRSFFDPMAGVKLSQTYPNPAKSTDQIPISFSLPRDGKATLELLDFNGDVVTTLFSGEVEADSEKELSFTPVRHQLSPGNYVYKLTTAKGYLTKRIFLTK